MTEDDLQVTITLPKLPPPLSACFNNSGRGGRVKSARYKAWIKLCGHTMLCWDESRAIKYRPYISGPVAVDYKFARPDNRKRDLGNLEKAISDFLVRMNVIEDDSLIQDLRLRWVEQGESPVTITVTPFVGRAGA